jgi:putative thioredoxin
MADSKYVFEIRDDFARVVLENSQRVPVLVDFWAAWCAPCRMLMPILAQLAEAYGGKFLLAKVNSDEQPELAAEYGVRSLPTVKLFRGGQVVDEFVGALPESQIRAWLDRHIPRESDARMAQAIELFQRGERDAAFTLAARAHADDADNARVAVQYLALLLDGNRLDDADALRRGFSAALQAEPLLKSLGARLELARHAADAPDIPALQARLSENPDDLRGRLQLAARLAAREDYEPALRELLEVMRRNRSFDDGAAHRRILKIFELLGESHPLVSQSRRELARLLY